jgi:hypothetical protein
MARDKVEVNSLHIYRAYIRSLDSVELKTGYKIPRYELNKAVHEVNKRIMSNMLLKNTFIRLPHNLGVLSVMKFKPVIAMTRKGKLTLPVDIPASIKLWESDPNARENKKYIYHRNQHTGGYIIRTRWEKRGSKINNISAYKFKPVKDFKRLIYATLMDPLSKVDFYELNEKVPYKPKKHE